MKRTLKRILPILLVIVVILSIIWYLFIYDTGFTRDMMLKGARYFESRGNHSVATWIYHQAYRQSSNDESVAIELANQFKELGNYTKAEATLSDAISDGGSVELYIALCKTYVEQDKLLDAVVMLNNVADSSIKNQLDSMRPEVPTADQAPGFYNQYISVSLNSSSGTLYASSDGEYPSAEEDLYQSPIRLKAGETTVYALSIGENGLVSPLAVFGYTVGNVVEPVNLQDNALDRYVRENLKIANDAQLYTSDLWKLTSVTVPGDMQHYEDLALFTSLESLTLEGAAFKNLQFISKMQLLRNLTVRDSVVSSEDMAVIASLPRLENLTLSGCSIASISRLENAQNLVSLDLSHNALRDLSPLSFMSTLRKLDLNHNALDNLSALSALSGLKELDVSYNSLTSVAPLAVCTALESVNLSNNMIDEISAFQNFTTLKALNISSNKLTDIASLSGCTELQKLDLSRNEIESIHALSKLMKLKELDFSYNQVAVMPAWDKNCALVTVSGSYNKLKSLTQLSGCQSLETVLMDYNKITSVKSLASCPKLKRVDVYGSRVKDAAQLKSLGVTVNYNPV